MNRGNHNWALSGLLFAFGLGASWHFGWQVHDVIWSFWITSLATGYLLLGASLWHTGRHMAREAGMDSSRVVTGILVLAGFFTVHFGFFHWGQAQFMAAFLPWPETSRLGLGQVPEVLVRYWPIVVAGLVFRLADVRALLMEPVPTTAPAQEFKQAMGESIKAPYAGVVRLHIAIFGLVFASLAGIPDGVLFVVAYAWFFLPFDLGPGTPGSAQNRKAL